MTSPSHADNAQEVMGAAWEAGTEGVAWQKILLMLAQAHVEATLAVADELRQIRATLV